MTFTYLINLTVNERDGEHLCESACGVRLCLCVQSINPVFRDSPSLLPAHHFPTLEAVSQHHHTFHRAVTCCCRGNRLLFSFFCLSDHGIKCHFVWVAVDPLVTNTNTHTTSEAHVPLTHVCTDKPFCLPHSKRLKFNWCSFYTLATLQFSTFELALLPTSHHCE